MGVEFDIHTEKLAIFLAPHGVATSTKYVWVYAIFHHHQALFSSLKEEMGNLFIDDKGDGASWDDPH